MNKDNNSSEPPEVEVVDFSYQPSKAELDADLRVDATLEQAISAAVRPVKIKHIPRPRRR